MQPRPGFNKDNIKIEFLQDTLAVLGWLNLLAGTVHIGYF